MEISVTFEPLDGFSNFKKVKWWEFNFPNVQVDLNWTSIHIRPYTSGVRADMDWSSIQIRPYTSVYGRIWIEVQFRSARTFGKLNSHHFTFLKFINPSSSSEVTVISISYSLSFSSKPPKRMDVPEEGNPSLSQSSNTSDLDLAQLDALELSTHVNHPRKWTILRRVAGVASGVPTKTCPHPSMSIQQLNYFIFMI